MVQYIAPNLIQRDNRDSRPRMRNQMRGGGVVGGSLVQNTASDLRGHKPSNLQHLINATNNKNASNLDRLKKAGGGCRAKKKMKKKKK